jgi:adenosylcobinamide-GDP ribazoletransferase
VSGRPVANAWQAWRWALQFLTRLPLRRRPVPGADVQAQSVLFYPLVGLAIGALLAVFGAVLVDVDAGVGAALLLAAWVGVTGALHLDGVADTADAWLGSHGDRERALEIMKDPRSGAAGVTAVGLILILKFAALGALLAEYSWLALWIAPLLGRAAIVLMLLRLPYRAARRARRAARRAPAAARGGMGAACRQCRRGRVRTRGLGSPGGGPR